MKNLSRCISGFILFIFSLSLSRDWIFAVGQEDVSELVAMHQGYSEKMNMSRDLLEEKSMYEVSTQNGTRTLQTFESTSDLIGKSYIVSERSSFSRDIENRIVTSELLERTMIFNKNRESIDPTTLAIEPLTGPTKVRTENMLRKLYKKEQRVMTFEFGIKDTHLIFSEPVRLSVDVEDAPDGTEFDLLVLHAGDINYNTKGLMTQGGGKCLPDGSATIPASRGVVKNKKIEFYTCGASTFSLGYVPKIDLPNNTVWAIASDVTRKTIIGGDFTTVGTTARTRLARLTKEGFLDTTFINSNVNNTVNAIAIQGDGKIIIGGLFTTVGGVGRNSLAQLNTDGTLDTTWNPNVNNQVRSIVIQSDGKVLIGGNFTTVGGVGRNFIARFNIDGTLDATFNPNANSTVYTLSVQGDGKILIGGNFTTVGGVGRNRIARLNADGTLDATFNPNANGIVWDIKIFSDNTIALGGAFTTIGGTGRNRIAKVSTLGVLDATWNPNANGTVQSILVDQSDNSLILGGAFTTIAGTARNRIAKVIAAGTLEATFNPNANNTVNVLSRRIDGTVSFGGLFTTVTGFAQNRYAEIRNNALDTEFNLGLNGNVWTLTPSPLDTSVILGGQFTTINGIARGRVARVSTGGFLDTTFTNPNVNNTVYATAIQSDGKIIIGGAFTTVGGVGRNYLARLNTDGTLDATWNPNLNNQVRAITIQADGKILVGGSFTTVGGVGRNRVARFNVDGTLDATFNPNANNIVYAITLEPDAQILVGGQFTTIVGTARNRVARLNVDGTLDATFNPNANNIVFDIELFSDGTIALGGQFTTVGGVARNRIAKVSAVGVLDAAWNPNVAGGATPIVYAIKTFTDNTTIFGGVFTTVAGVARNRIAKVSATGVLDATLNPNANNIVYTLGVDIHANLLVGGAFTTFSTKAVPYFSWLGLSTDTTAPAIQSINVLSGTLVPGGNFPIRFTYTETESGIDPTSLIGKLFSWDATGSTWSPVNIASSYLSLTISSTGTGQFQVTNLPFGKYRFEILISDMVGNTLTQSYTYYVDAIDWTISAPIYDIGTAPLGTDTFGSGELIVTVSTVGAGFDLSLLRQTDLGYSGQTISVYSGSTGWGYDKNTGSGYSSTITAHGTTQTIISVPKNINFNGQKTTYSYRVKFGMNPNANNVAGDYMGSVSFGINLNY